MTKVTHPSLRRGKGTTAQTVQPRSFVVSDETESNGQHTRPPQAREIAPGGFDDLDDRLKQFEAGPSDYSIKPDIVDQPIEAVEKSPAVSNKLPQKTLEELLFAGRVKTEFSIAGNKYVIATLTNKEQNYVITEMYGFGDAADLFVIKSLTLAMALKSINGVDIGDILMDGEFKSDVYQRKEVIDNLQVSIVEKLYDNYSKMISEGNRLVLGEDLKK